MAAATTLIAGSSALLSGGMAVKGALDKKKAQNELNNLEVPELDNAFENFEISTLGSDLIKEQSQLVSSNLIDVAQGGGMKGVMSAIPQIVALNNKANRKAQVYIDGQIMERNKLRANDDIRLRRMNERRYQNDVDGLGTAINVGEQNMWNGINNIISSGMTMTRGMNKSSDSDFEFDDFDLGNSMPSDGLNIQDVKF